MPYPKDSIFKDKVVRQMIGKACYVEVAMRVGGIWSPAKLEEKIDGDINSDPSGRFRRMQNGVLPSNKYIYQMLRTRTFKDKTCQIKKWRNHPFWKLLSINDVPEHDLLKSFEKLKGPVRRIIWADQGRSHRKPSRSSMDEKEELKKVASYKNVDALQALITLSREGFQSNKVKNHTIPALFCKDIFPEVMISCPHLYISWKALGSRLMEVMWDPPDNFPFYVDFKGTLAEMEERINTLDEIARSQGIPLPPKEILDRYN